MAICAVILVGGPNKGTRLRPLSLNVPKSLLSIAGKEMVEHQISCLNAISDLKTIYIVGTFDNFREIYEEKVKKEAGTKIVYVDEGSPKGTAGSLLFMKQQAFLDGYDTIILTHCDVACDYPFQQMIDYYHSINRPDDHRHVVLSICVPKDVSHHFGCLVIDKTNNQVMHYVEKPTTFMSENINGGIAVFNKSLLGDIEGYSKTSPASILGMGEIYPVLVNKHALYTYHFNKLWCSVKTPSDALHANKLFLSLMKKEGEELVYVKSPCTIDPKACIHPNVFIDSDCVVKSGVRISNSIILKGSVIEENCYIKDAIIGPNCTIEPWCRIEGHHCTNYFDYFRKVRGNDSYFTNDGKFYPSVTVLGSNVRVNKMLMLYNSIVLPYKEINTDCKQELIM